MGIEKRIHFFKIIHDDAIRDEKLGIPKKFIIKYGSGLSSPVILKVPCGAIWKVELLKCDGEVWLEKGWKEFAKYYSLEYGHLLVFEYKGQCNFQVVILNKSAVEIEYPCDITCAAKPNPEGKSQEAKVEANKDKISDEILDDQPLCSKTREKSFLSPQSCKKMRIDSETPNISLSHTLPADTSPNGTLEPLIPDKDVDKAVGGQITQPSCSNTSPQSIHSSGLL